ncbi:unnamed protein product [Calypogeia fissa]
MMREVNRRLHQTQIWLSRRFPRTLSTFQLVLVCGFVSILVLRSAVGSGSLSTSVYSFDQPQLEIDDLPRSEAKRNLAQLAEVELKVPPFQLGPKITNWDEQRAAWLEAHPNKRYTSTGKPKVVLATGTSPWPCDAERGDYINLKSLKNKIDYARIHEYELFYNVAFFDDSLNSLWAKLPLIRKLMLTHPEAEWIFWVDADAVITDMVFEMPLEKYDQYDLIMWGFDKMIFEDKNWVGMNTGVFFIRNNQWSLDLLDMWVPMGPDGTVRNEAGKFFTENLTEGKGRKRPVMPADDQSALVWLMLTKEELLRPKIYLESRKFILSGYFDEIVDHFEEFMEKNHPGLGDHRWPFTTHFTGCQPCTGKGNPVYTKDRCTVQFERAFNFADNQVMSLMGFHHRCLECVELKRVADETDKPLNALNGDNTWLPSASKMKPY